MSDNKNTEQHIDDEVRQFEIEEYRPVAAALTDLRKRYGSVVFDVTTRDGMREAKTAQKDIAQYRLELESKRKEIKEPALRRCQHIDDEARTIREAIEAIENPIKAQIKNELDRRKREEEERIEAERQRVQTIEDRINHIERIPDVVRFENWRSNVIEDEIARLTDWTRADVEQWAQESTARAVAAIDDTIGRLRDMRDIAANREEEDRRRAEEQKRIDEENERLRKDREKQEAEDRERREREEAEAKRVREEQEAKDRELRERQDAIEREEKRIAAEKQAEADRKAAIKADADRKAKAAAERRKREEYPGLAVIVDAMVDAFDVSRDVVEVWMTKAMSELDARSRKDS